MFKLIPNLLQSIPFYTTLPLTTPTLFHAPFGVGVVRGGSAKSYDFSMVRKLDDDDETILSVGMSPTTELQVGDDRR